TSAFVILVDAEVDSMGGVGIGSKTSPLRAEIEKVHSELRQEYNVRDEKRRELEYLEKGGNPLDFMLGNVASVSVQSTSLKNHNPDRFVTSEAKGSFAYLASLHGDSVESSGRPGAAPPEANSADNIMLFDGKNEFSEGDQNSSLPSIGNIAPLEKSSHIGGSQNVKEFGDSDAFSLPRKAYKRRHRSRPNNDRIKSSTAGVVLTRGGHISSLPLQGSTDVKELVSDAENYNGQNGSSNYNSKPTSPMENTLHMTVPSVSQRDMELDCVRVVKSTKNPIKDGSPNGVSDTNTSKNPLANQHNQQSVSEAEKSPVQITSDGAEPFQSREEVISAVVECQPSVIPTKVENQSSSCHMNGLSSGNDDQIKNYAQNAQNSSTERGTKGLDSESSCTQTILGIDGNNESHMCANIRNVDSNGSINNQVSLLDGIPVAARDEFVREKKETNANDNSTFVDVRSNSAYQSHQENGIVLNVRKELNGSGPALQNELKAQVILEGIEAGGPTVSESERKSAILSRDNPDPASISHQDSIDTSILKFPKASMARVSTDVASEAQISSVPNLLFASKVDEDSILEEAGIMEAKRKRLMELSMATSPLEIRRKSHWDYVLEEMAWLANDFVQERRWKITAAAQTCRRAVFTSQLTKQEKASDMKVKKVAYNLAKAVMEFWHSVQEKREDLELQSPKEGALAVKVYAMNFLKYNNSSALPCHAEAPSTPDRISDLGILDMSREAHLTEVCDSWIWMLLFYHRDGRYGVPSSTSLSIDEQQRMQQYNQIISGRNIQQHTMSAPGAFPGADRGARMFTGSSGTGMVSGVNRSMSMARPGFQGLVSSSMVNSGSMVSPGALSVNMQSGLGSGQGNTVFRPRDNLNMMRPGMIQDLQRQMIVSDLQMQASPGSSQGVSSFGGKNSPLPNQTASQPVSSFPVHHQLSHPVSPQKPQVLSSHHSHLQGGSNHPPNPQQQAPAMRLAKERQVQHRFLQQQQQFTASNSLMQHVPQQPQLPISSPLQNNSQVQSQTSSPLASHSPSTSASMNSMLQQQQKHQIVSSANHIGKQRQRQQVLHGNRPHPLQRQQTQGQQQVKLSKGVGRGNLMHQNIQVDPSLLDGMSNTGNQSSEKGEQTTHLMQGQSSYPGPQLNAVQPMRQYVPSQSSNQSLPQQKTYSGSVFSSAKYPPQKPSHSDTSGEGQVPLVVAASTSSAGHQSVPTATVASSNHQQALPHQKFVNQNPESLQRGFQQNSKPNSDPPNKRLARDCHTEQHAISSSEMCPMTTLPQVCNISTIVGQVISPPSAQQNGTEPSFDSDTSNSPTNLGSLVPPPVSSSESMTTNSQGPDQRLLSTSLPKIKHDFSAQRQHQPSKLQPLPSPVTQPQQQQQQQ
ncbi:chromatin modification-related protein EAF1 A-like, partial [Olea europaea var. sylvestris]|uniref:chromatin modification-related protein EAF1 A-like n=1 Tax=Olea europaea var. sylvestris TaxID=158386 RepID=UPI000C1D1507